MLYVWIDSRMVGSMPSSLNVFDRILFSLRDATVLNEMDKRYIFRDWVNENIPDVPDEAKIDGLMYTMVFSTNIVINFVEPNILKQLRKILVQNSESRDYISACISELKTDEDAELVRLNNETGVPLAIATMGNTSFQNVVDYYRTVDSSSVCLDIGKYSHYPDKVAAQTIASMVGQRSH